jgi:RND family efflux transporter MFP subunit
MARQNIFICPYKILPIVSLLFSFLTACSGKSLKASRATPTPIPTPVIAAKTTYQVQRGDMVNELKFSGRITPQNIQELSFTVGGSVAKIYVQRGDSVTKDQLLTELESGQSEFDLRRAQINLKIEQLRLELAKLQTPRFSDTYTVTLAIQKQEVALAQVALDELNASYNSVRITSPISGTVFSISIAEGNTVEANKPVIEIADMTKLIISADLSADQMTSLTVGMKVTIDSVGRSISETQGTILNLPYPYGSADQGHGVSSAQIMFDQSPTESGYEVGDMVDMTITLEKKTDTLWLPVLAVREYQGRYFVIVQEGDSQRRVDIKTGITEADRIEILDGLTEGQVVIAP